MYLSTRGCCGTWGGQAWGCTASTPPPTVLLRCPPGQHPVNGRPCWQRLSRACPPGKRRLGGEEGRAGHTVQLQSQALGGRGMGKLRTGLGGPGGRPCGCPAAQLAMGWERVCQVCPSVGQRASCLAGSEPLGGAGWAAQNSSAFG